MRQGAHWLAVLPLAVVGSVAGMTSTSAVRVPTMTADITLVNCATANSVGGWDYGPANVATPFGLFPENLDPGQLLTSLPIAADFGLVSLAGVLELETIAGAATSIVGDFAGLF